MEIPRRGAEFAENVAPPTNPLRSLRLCEGDFFCLLRQEIELGKERSEKFLVIGVHRLDDAVMSLPALQILREEHPAVEITLLGKPTLSAFWEMCPSIDFFQPLEPITWGYRKSSNLGPLSECSTRSAVIQRSWFPMLEKLRRQKFDRAYILPNSFRSALIPFMAGIPRRVGARGRWRRMMLTEIVHLGTGHQQFEAISVFGVQGTPKPPALQVPEKSFQTLERKLVHFPTLGKNQTALFQALETCTAAGGNEKPIGARPVITLLPGAARGSAKGWPEENFSLLAKNLCSSMNAVVLLGGGPEDVSLCKGIETKGYDIINLAGQTTFSEWAAMLQASDCVVANDSGGMHLASAVGTPVVGLYGLADAERTGPLGKHVVLQKKEATRAVAAIGADEVYGAIEKLLAAR